MVIHPVDSVIHLLNLGTFVCRPGFAKQQREMTKFYVAMYFGEREPQWLIFGIFFWN